MTRFLPWPPQIEVAAGILRTVTPLYIIGFILLISHLINKVVQHKITGSEDRYSANPRI